MPSNNKTYSKRYHARKRNELIASLGGKCEACNGEIDLVVHRIFTSFNAGLTFDRQQMTFDGDVDTEIPFNQVSESVKKERKKLLYNNPDNMVVLCYQCYSILRRIYGRKKRIGRKEIEYLKGL